ncbi:MAG TPA: hypothetical protein DDY31_14510 [Lachnospiraceae bacterium]|nr:hypothetical protein [Lachnospiraceae bacterium]
MKKTYKCSNIKFCMEDENQRRTWEYLQGVTRKDGSYGKILSDAFVVAADEGKSFGTDKAGNDFTDLKEDVADVFQEMLDRMLEQKFQEMLQKFQDFFEEQISRGIWKYNPDIHFGVDVPSETDGMGQMRKPELSEDMMAFAFAMGE